MTTTAIYPNRLLDKKELEEKLKLPECGNQNQQFFLPNDSLFANGYVRVVYGDHGPYLEFEKSNIVVELKSKFGNKIDFNNLPDLDYKYYYFWLYPDVLPEIKVYLQIKPVTNLPNAPRRQDGKKSSFNRKEGYADYRRGFFYVDPYCLKINNGE